MKHKSGRNDARAVMLLLAVLIAGPVLAAGENIHLYGALVAEPCVIPPGEEVIALDFGSVIDKYLYLNTRTQGQSFSIHLTECDVSLGKTVKVTFLGTENAALPGLLALDGGSQATGIAIGLETEKAKPVPINTESDTYLLQAGDNRIALKAYVKGEPQAIANRTIGYGPFGAVATFALEYE
ncbi:fimbrial protein [Pantoea ananatis]|uniref:fimbrial protein n=1 Tax=Pantoea ananas TaxID=553 RepID=UPI000491517E|nr:fimbrial protein [Pantoea ananatis]